MTDILKNAETALTKAKVHLMTRPDSAFITTVLFSLKFVWDERIPTACVNGVQMRINPEFFLSLNKDLQVFVLAHETWHVCFMHVIRGKEFSDFRRYNRAADYYINRMLEETGFQIWDQALLSGEYDGYSVDEIYGMLDEDGDPDFTEDFETSSEDLPDPEELEEHINSTLIRAQIATNMSSDSDWGNIPGEVKRYVEGLLNPKLPWNSILHGLVDSYDKSDYSYRRFNRKGLGLNIYMPSLYNESIDNITVALDLSGSVSENDHRKFVTEINAIKEQLDPQVLTVLNFDTCITHQQDLIQGEDVTKLVYTGGGGTCIEDVFAYAEANEPTVMIIFTDGYFHMYEYKADCPIIWIIYDNPDFNPPVGEVVHYER